LAEYFTGSTIEAHIGDWYVPIPVPVEYEWINGDILALKIDFTRYYGLNQNHSPATILAAVTGETSGNTRFFMLSRKQGSNEYEFAGEMTIGRASTGSGTGIDWASSYDENTNKWTYSFDPTAWTIKNDHVDGTTADPKYVTLVFDDITVGGSASTFSKLMCEETDTNDNFIPGENLTVRVNTLQSWEELQSDWNTLTATEKARTQTNSLFDDGSDPLNATKKTAYIASIRHLENLDGSISDYAPGSTATVSAEQTADMIYSGTCTTGGETISSFRTNTNAPDSFLYTPVSPAYTLEYTGKYGTDGPKNVAVGGIETVAPAIIGVTVGETSQKPMYAGVFGTLKESDTVTNLELLNVSAAAAAGGSAGALAGTSSGTVTGVLVRNTTYGTASVQATNGGSAGGLIGSMSGGTVEQCAAAVPVSAAATDTNTCTAGGLIGSMTGGTVSNSYSGGHTVNGNYSDSAFNVTATTGIGQKASKAGGLVGDASGASTITNCYSTCSVSGTTFAGGLIGNATSTSVQNCYSVGLVKKENQAGAIGGMTNGVTFTDCACLDVGSYTGETPLAAIGSGSSTGIVAMDSYDEINHKWVFNDWAPQTGEAKPYDTTLKTKYGDKYVFKTISTTTGDYSWTTTHYGDWPSLETLVVNESASASTP
jgi:hypothetical protein